MKKYNDGKPHHKYNGGLGATLCHNCRVIINTGFSDRLYCDTCAENKVLYHNRHRDKIIFEHIDDKVIMTGGKWIRWGYDDENNITMVDPSGGPYIELGNNLNGFWPEAKYQNLIIDKIEFGDDTDNEESTIIFTIKK